MLASLTMSLLDVLVTGRVGVIFGISFVLICLRASLAIKPRDAFTATVLPPLVFGATMAMLAPFMASRLAPGAVSASQGLLGGLAAHAGWLVAAYIVALLITARRTR